MMPRMGRSDRLRTKTVRLTVLPPSAARDAAVEAAVLRYVARAQWEDGRASRFWRLPVLRHSIAINLWMGERPKVAIPVALGFLATVLLITQPWRGCR